MRRPSRPPSGPQPKNRTPSGGRPLEGRGPAKGLVNRTAPPVVHGPKRSASKSTRRVKGRLVGRPSEHSAYGVEGPKGKGKPAGRSFPEDARRGSAGRKSAGSYGSGSHGSGGHASGGHASGGHASGGRAGKAAFSKRGDQAFDGEPRSPRGKPPSGKASFGKPASGKPFGKPASGKSFGKPPFGHSASGKAASGKPAFGKPARGKPFGERSDAGRGALGAERPRREASRAEDDWGSDWVPERTSKSLGFSSRDAGPRAARPNAGPASAGPASAGKARKPTTRGAGRTNGGSPRAGQSGELGGTSPRVPLRQGKPLTGPWLWLTRAGSENDLLSELRLSLGESAKGRELVPGLARSELAATLEDGALDATFARHGVRVRATLPTDPVRIASEVAKLAAKGPISFDVIVPDSDEGNRLAGQAVALETDILARLEKSGVIPVERERARESDARLVDLVLASSSEAFLGEIESGLALTLHAQGRARMKVSSERPSRAARKVEEALDWLGVGPGAGEVCVDLGAAPGGWSWSLLERRARVIAVDPAELRPDVARHPRLTHIKASAFQFAPDETVDWLFCDMAWRPREAVQMLAKWARKRWARTLVANLKLPMKTKAEMVKELREIVHGGGWQRVRSRQLYHDRDEITLTAHT